MRIYFFSFTFSYQDETECRPRSVEQRSLFEAGEDEATVIQEPEVAVEDRTPPPRKSEAFLRTSSDTTFPTVTLPPTPNLASRAEAEDDLLPPTPRVWGNNSFEILPPTPNIAEPGRPAPLIRKESDKSFSDKLEASKEAPLLKSVMLKAAASTCPQPPAQQLTPKRMSDADHREEGSAQKKLRMEADVNWAVHRESAEVPSTPLSSKNLNETYDSIPDSPEARSNSLNETVTLVSNLGKQCDLKSPEHEAEGRNLNSTFAVEVRHQIASINRLTLISTNFRMSPWTLTTPRP